MYKYQILNSFIDEYKDLPEQGTEEWKKLRKGFIGGSEISSVLKQNKNKSVNKLVLEKLGFDRFQGNVITHWGNVFEEIIRLHCEEEFNCEIRETGSIPYKEGYLSYSPDGLSVIPTKRLIQKFPNAKEFIDDKCPAQLVLFEFKCPHSRIPTNEIPEHYLPQVSIGMNIIDIMETAIFVQGTYRRCSFKQLAYDASHNPYGHFKKADISSNPIECGFMTIYCDEHDEYTESLKEVLIEVGEASEIYIHNTTVIDIGSIYDQSLLEEVLGHCVTKKFKIMYCFRHKYDQAVFDRDDYYKSMYNQSLMYKAEQMLGNQLEKNIIGIIPYKLLNIFMTQVKKNSSYIADSGAHTKAQQVLQCIEDHRGQEGKEDVRRSIRKYKL